MAAGDGAATTLDALLPAPHFRERHQRRIAAPPPAVWDALHELRLGDSRIGVALMAIRSLPAVLSGNRPPAILKERFVEHAPVPVLATEPNRSLLAGGVMQPWKLLGGSPPPVLDAEALAAFTEPGWVACGMDFVLHNEGATTTLSTETRVRATDPGTRRRFGLYWLAIRAGSGIIRRGLLAAVARRAEAATAARRSAPGVAVNVKVGVGQHVQG